MNRILRWCLAGFLVGSFALSSCVSSVRTAPSQVMSAQLSEGSESSIQEVQPEAEKTRESNSPESSSVTVVPSPSPLTVTAPAPENAGSALKKAEVGDVPPPETNGPSVRRNWITIDTYDYQSAYTDTQESDPIYPYPRLDHDRIGDISAKMYPAIVLENQYLELTILPSLGGRIYRWIDKGTGRNLFYENPVIVPTTWGYRGWWLATGGMEWALPVEEHGLSEAFPWEYQIRQSDDWASITLSDVEEHSGLISKITIKLDGEHAYFTLTPIVQNPTDETVSYKFWINGMFGLGEHQVGPGIEFVLPGEKVYVHSTGDESLPQSGQKMTWPEFQGRDFSDYGQWESYLGVFAAPRAQAGYMGAFNQNTQLGVARIFPYELVKGAKVFALGDIEPTRWTTDGSSYFELWGGIAPTFDDTVVLEAGDFITWEERWYAVNDTGGFNFANENGTLNLDVGEISMELAASATHQVNGKLVLWHDGNVAEDWSVSLSPTKSFRTKFQPLDGNPDAQWGLSLHDADGLPLMAVGEIGTAGQDAKNTEAP